MENATRKSKSQDNKVSIYVCHRTFGKGHMHTITDGCACVTFEDGIDRKFPFPKIFSDSKYNGILDIESDWKNAKNAIDFLVKNNLLKSFVIEMSEKAQPEQKISWMQECVIRYILLQILNKHGFVGFMHTTHFENFKMIYNFKKMLPRNMLESSGIEFIDCADTEIIGKTNNSVKDSVRFYYRCKTPTNYSALNDHGQVRPVIFALNPECIYDKSAVFYDGNARANKTNCTYSALSAISFNWICIFSSVPAYHNETTDAFLNEQNCSLEELKRMQNAEFLFTNAIDISCFNKIYFMTKSDYNEAIQIFGNNDKFEYKPEFFPRKRYYG